MFYFINFIPSRYSLIDFLSNFIIYYDKNQEVIHYIMENQQKQNIQSLLATNTLISTNRKNLSRNTCSNNKTNSQSNRSKLSTATFIKWLRSRFQSSLPKRFQYLYFPHQLTRETSIEQIFVQFDSDGSGGLSRDEVYDMFRGFGINITMDHLNQLYDSVEVNLEELDCQMFKKCALGQKSNKVFRQIVRQIEFNSEQQRQYLPHNFTNMIIYLVYLSKRQEIKNKIQENKIPIQNKVQNIENLLKLRDLSLNNERLTLYTENMKKHLKIKFRDIWQRVNENHGQKYSLSPKLEEQFYNFYLKNGNIQTSSTTALNSKQKVQREPKLSVSKKRL